MKQGQLVWLTDSQFESQCPFCEHDNVKTRERATERDVVRCEVCGNKYQVSMDKHELFGGVEC